jgi:hypothetical protein
MKSHKAVNHILKKENDILIGLLPRTILLESEAMLSVCSSSDIKSFSSRFLKDRYLTRYCIHFKTSVHIRNYMSPLYAYCKKTLGNFQ